MTRPKNEAERLPECCECDSNQQVQYMGLNSQFLPEYYCSNCEIYFELERSAEEEKSLNEAFKVLLAEQGWTDNDWDELEKELQRNNQFEQHD